MPQTIMQRMREHIRLNEGKIPTPYKDSEGYLTIGTGFLVDDEKSFVAMPLEIKDASTGKSRRATDAEKKTEFYRVLPLSNADIKSKFELPLAEDDQNLDSEIKTRIESVKKEVGPSSWANLTDGQKTAVLDVHYANGDLHDFTKLKAAIKAGDAVEMAKQSDFHGGKIDGSNELHRNFDRLRRNRAEILGIDPESPEAYRAVAAAYPDHSHLPAAYKAAMSGTPPAKAVPDAPPPTSAVAAPPQASTDAGGDSYTIQAGDTLGKIAARHGVSPDALAKANGIADPDSIRAGKKLTIPGQPGAAGATAVPAPASSDTPPPAVPGSQGSPAPTEPPASPAPESAQSGDPQAPQVPKPEAPEPPPPPADPRAEAMVKMASSPVTDPARAAFLKPTATVTEPEMKTMLSAVRNDFPGWRASDPLRTQLDRKVQDWHRIAYDGPTPAAMPTQPAPHVTADGEDLWQATGRVGRQVADAATTDGLKAAVMGLQRGLNILNQPGTAGAAPPVAEDGQYGPQTDFALKHAAARLGGARVEDALALGRFNTFARAAEQSGSAEGLDDATRAAFAPVLRAPGDDQSLKVEGGVLQQTLNEMGSAKDDSWEPLKLDTWIGPKTTEAFGTVLADQGADDLTAAFGRALGMG